MDVSTLYVIAVLRNLTADPDKQRLIPQFSSNNISTKVDDKEIKKQLEVLSHLVEKTYADITATLKVDDMVEVLGKENIEKFKKIIESESKGDLGKLERRDIEHLGNDKLREMKSFSFATDSICITKKLDTKS